MRIQFTASGTSREAFDESQRKTGALQSQMWHVVTAEATQRRDPETALFVSALNDSIDSTEKRTAALEDQIPATAWGMLLFVAAVGSLLVGTGLRSRSTLLRAVLPVVLGAALALTYDLDSPRSGLIHVQQQSMLRVQQQVSAAPVD